MISYKTNPPQMYCPHCLNPCITHWLSTLSGGGGSPPIKIQHLTNLLLKNWYSIFGHPYQFNITKLRLGTTLLTPRMSSYVAHQAGKSFMSDNLCFTTPVSATSTCVLVLFEQYEQPKKCVQERFSSSFLMHMLCKN